MTKMARGGGDGGINEKNQLGLVVGQMLALVLVLAVIAGFFWMMNKDAKRDNMTTSRPAWLPGFIDGDQASVSRPGAGETGFGEFTA